jgi:hypothetical protein
MKMTPEQELHFGVQYMKEVSKLVRQMSKDKDRLIKTMREFDFTEGFDFNLFAKQALLDHVKTYHDMEVAVFTVNQIIE